VVHRDVKPENVMLGDDHVFLTDFGIAKPLDRTRDSQLTVAGVLVETPVYIAPEQLGTDASTDHRADIYSLAILAYELLAGEPPFTNLELGPLLSPSMGGSIASITSWARFAGGWATTRRLTRCSAGRNDLSPRRRSSRPRPREPGVARSPGAAVPATHARVATMGGSSGGH
jgi:serine/threonine protein kinase